MPHQYGVARESFPNAGGEGRVWYRYHHLFADFLQQRLLAERPEQAERLIVRLSERYRQQRAWDRIYMLYRRLGRVDQTAPLLEEIGAELFEDGRIITLQEWLDELPETAIQRNPTLLSIKGNILLIKGNVQEGLTYLDQSLNLYSENQKIQRVETLVRHAAALRRIGDYNGALRDVNEALSLIDDCSNNRKLCGIILQQKGVILYHQGYMREALATFEQSLHHFEEPAESNFIAFTLMEMGTINRL